MIYLRALIIGLLIFTWALGYKFLSWDDNRDFAKNLLYAMIRASHLGFCLLVIGWLQKMAIIDAVGSIIWGVAFGFMFVLIYALCWISREMADEEADNNNL